VTSRTGRWAPRTGLLVALILLAVWGAARMVEDLRPVFTPIRGKALLYDFRIMVLRLGDYHRSGVLYNTKGVDAFGPKTITMFKYPPPHAALVMLLTDTRAPAGKIAVALTLPGAFPMVILYLVAVAGALALSLSALRAPPIRVLVIVAAALHWQPTLESLTGPQVEPLLLLLLAIMLSLWGTRRWFGSGIPLGVAGALKVYPWALLIMVVLRRRWRCVLGTIAGAAGAFLLSGILIPLRYSVEYLTRIMPRLSGISIDPENVGLLGSALRLAYALTGEKPPATLRLLADPWWTAPRTALPVAIGLLLFLSLLIAVVALTRRALSRHPVRGTHREEMIWFSLGVCLLPAFLPTSWMNYQVLLILPLAVSFALAPPVRDDPPTWLLLGVVMVTGGIRSGVCPTPIVVARTILPLVLWWVLLRLISQGTSGTAQKSAPGKALANVTSVLPESS
jgi:hypothetical protein